MKEPAVSAAPAGRRRARCVFEDVHFDYQPGQPVLHGVNLRIAAGQRTAIVGPTGSGKSSLASLIPRFYERSAGRVLLDGVDVRDIALRELRRAVSSIFQDTFLFSMTIAENIAYGRPGCLAPRTSSAARGSRRSTISSPASSSGYDTVIGERGMSLSGGQKQRIAIARALLMDPRVLILDDCTASVDAETEKKLRGRHGRPWRRAGRRSSSRSGSRPSWAPTASCSSTAGKSSREGTHARAPGRLPGLRRDLRLASGGRGRLPRRPRHDRPRRPRRGAGDGAAKPEAPPPAPRVRAPVPPALHRHAGASSWGSCWRASRGRTS